MIRPVLPGDTATLVALGEATGIFGPGEADALLRDTLDALQAGQLEPGHEASAWVDPSDGSLGGWVYFAPRNTPDGAWDLWWIGVAPVRHGQGVGEALLVFVESRVAGRGGRVLSIETSSQPALARARRFYTKKGYVVDAVVTDHFGEGDDKVVFVKQLDELGGSPKAGS